MTADNPRSPAQEPRTAALLAAARRDGAQAVLDCLNNRITEDQLRSILDGDDILIGQVAEAAKPSGSADPEVSPEGADALLRADLLQQCPSLMAILNRLGKFNEAWWDRLADEYATAARRYLDQAFPLPEPESQRGEG